MSSKIHVKTPEEIELMRQAGKLLVATMNHIEKLLQPGTSSKDIDAEAERYIRENGGIPSFKGYGGFPATLCMSFNEQVVHGIPGERKLAAGDLIGIDCGVILNGYQSDMARSYHIGGETPKDIEKLIRATRESLNAGIAQAKAGNRVGDISNAVQRVAEEAGFSVVQALVGHGIGKSMHEEPQVPNFGPAGVGPLLKVGMVLAIEPMINQGTYHVKRLSDGWTYVTKDAKLSCHFEHTVAITANGPEIMTQ